jgi:uncharacterized membrane protein YgcG
MARSFSETLGVWLPAVFGVLALALPALADGIDRDLPADTPAPVRRNAREMVRAGMPETEAVRLTQRLVQQLEERRCLEIQSAVTAAVQEGVPAQPMIEKVHEGLSKNVPPEGIVTALNAVRSRYGEARRLAASLTPDPVKAGEMRDLIADGLAAGIRTRDLEAVREGLNQRARETEPAEFNDLCVETLAGLRDMARLGASSTAASETVGLALQQGYRVPEMARLRQEVRENARRVKGEEAVEQAKRSVKAGKSRSANGPSGKGADKDKEAGKGRSGEKGGGNAGGKGGGNSGGGGNAGGGKSK